ncbi:MAG: hypothetical protein OXF23_07475, partial [Candidatus Dadabacteria bacterium]|nr:hypothetical protein [Candidatus Dadabacteria bacterium]
MFRLALFTIGLLGLASCGDSNNPGQPTSDPSANVTLVLSGDSSVEESANPKLRLTLGLDVPVSEPVSVDLRQAGSAPRDDDSAVSKDEIQFPP